MDPKSIENWEIRQLKITVRHLMGAVWMPTYQPPSATASITQTARPIGTFSVWAIIWLLEDRCPMELTWPSLVTLHPPEGQWTILTLGSAPKRAQNLVQDLTDTTRTNRMELLSKWEPMALWWRQIWTIRMRKALISLIGRFKEEWMTLKSSV